MTIDEAVADMNKRITAASPQAIVRTMRVSDEEARISVYAPADHAVPIQAATFEPAVQLMTKEGLDVQVFVYDIATTTPLPQ